MQPIKQILPDAEVLRRNVIDRVNHLSTEELAAVHDLILDVEMQNAWQAFSDGMTEDWTAGKYDRLDEAVREAREKLRLRQGS